MEKRSWLYIENAFTVYGNEGADDRRGGLNGSLQENGDWRNSFGEVAGWTDPFGEAWMDPNSRHPPLIQCTTSTRQIMGRQESPTISGKSGVSVAFTVRSTASRLNAWVQNSLYRPPPHRCP